VKNLNNKTITIKVNDIHMNKIRYKKLSPKASKKKVRICFQFIQAFEYKVGKQFCLQTTGWHILLYKCYINGTCHVITQCPADGLNVTAGTFSNRKL